MALAKFIKAIWMKLNLQKENQYIVKRISTRKLTKRLHFNESKDFIDVTRWAGVSEGSIVEKHENILSVICKSGKAQLLPIYAARESIKIGNLNLEFLIKEITEEDELEAYQDLTRFHYRNHSLVGRRTRLIIRNYHPLYPKIVGYIELTTPFFMNKARANLLNSPFQLNGTSWELWDVDTRRKYTNLIIRIARCVVYPEFRGLGLGQMLVKNATEFARQHWQVGGLKPIFMEISADMLKFVPFAQKAGMIFIGDTEGNIERVARDMSYLLTKMKNTNKYNSLDGNPCGFLDQQMARASKAASLLEEQGWNLEELTTRLKNLNQKITLNDHLLFKGIVSFPKPTYLLGLNEDSHKFVEKRVEELSITNGNKPAPIVIEKLNDNIELNNLSLTYNSSVRRTLQTQAIQKAFDISPDDISHTVIDKLSIKIHPGQIILLTGSSGSGKSSLLRLFSNKISSNISGEIKRPSNYKAGIFETVNSKKALIEVLAPQDVQQTLHLLGIVGLSDAFVYLKRYSELSHGQQYRAMLAKLLISGCNVWLADEFCSALDPLTAMLVADRLQKVARMCGAVLIVASSQPENFVVALKPNIVVSLTTALNHQVISGKDFLHSLSTRASSFVVPHINISSKQLEVIKEGEKRSIIIKGRQKLKPEPILLKTSNEMYVIQVIDVAHRMVKHLILTDALEYGLQSLEELKLHLAEIHSDLTETSWFTIVYLKKELTI